MQFTGQDFWTYRLGCSGDISILDCPEKRQQQALLSVYIQVDLSGFKVNQGRCRVAVSCRLISPNDPRHPSDSGCQASRQPDPVNS
jgi:hypothetical protein